MFQDLFMIKKQQTIILLLTMLISSIIYPVFSAEIEVKTSVNRTIVGLNQNFQITVDVSGDKADKAGNPNMPDISDFAVYMGSSGTSQNIQFINGRMTAQNQMAILL